MVEVPGYTPPAPPPSTDERTVIEEFRIAYERLSPKPLVAASMATKAGVPHNIVIELCGRKKPHTITRTFQGWLIKGPRAIIGLSSAALLYDTSIRTGDAWRGLAYDRRAIVALSDESAVGGPFGKPGYQKHPLLYGEQGEIVLGKSRSTVSKFKRRHRHHGSVLYKFREGTSMLDRMSDALEVFVTQLSEGSYTFPVLDYGVQDGYSGPIAVRIVP